MLNVERNETEPTEHSLIRWMRYCCERAVNYKGLWESFCFRFVVFSLDFLFRIYLNFKSLVGFSFLLIKSHLKSDRTVVRLGKVKYR